MKDFYGRTDPAIGQDRVIVAPYSYPTEGGAGILPEGTQMVLIAWHRSAACDEVSYAAAFQFTAQYSAPTFNGLPYLGEAPEPGGQLGS